MYCANCGTAITPGARFCPACGTVTGQAHAPSPPTATVGFSPRINDPAFARYTKMSNRHAYIFSLILAVCAVVGFSIAGAMEVGGVENPTGIFIGLGLGAMFLLIALFQATSKKRSKTWDGTVVDKKVKKKTVYREDYNEYYTEYSVIIRSNQGKKHTIKNNDYDVIYNYYTIGDRVRHHGGLKTYEKYDKTGDTIIFCNACQTLCEITQDYCHKCNCPLLK